MAKTYYIPTGEWPLKIQPYHDLMKKAGFLQKNDWTADILLLPGGSDIGIRIERDVAEFLHYKEWTTAQKPVLGICRGLQLMLHLNEAPLLEHIPNVTTELLHTTITGSGGGNSSCRAIYGGIENIFICFQNRISRIIPSNVTSGSTTFISDFMSENPPGGVSTFALTATLSDIAWMPLINKFMVNATYSGTANRIFTLSYSPGGAISSYSFDSGNFDFPAMSAAGETSFIFIN